MISPSLDLFISTDNAHIQPYSLYTEKNVAHIFFRSVQKKPSILPLFSETSEFDSRLLRICDTLWIPTLWSSLIIQEHGSSTEAGGKSYFKRNLQISISYLHDIFSHQIVPFDCFHVNVS